MAKPGLDSSHVDACLKKVHRCRMAKSMGRNGSLSKSRDHIGRFVNGTPHDVNHSEPGEPPTSDIDEDRKFRLRWDVVLFAQCSKYYHEIPGKWYDSVFGSLSMQEYLRRCLKPQVRVIHTDSLRDPGTCA
jgi:hypothetical protein